MCYHDIFLTVGCDPVEVLNIVDDLEFSIIVTCVITVLFALYCNVMLGMVIIKCLFI